MRKLFIMALLAALLIIPMGCNSEAGNQDGSNNQAEQPEYTFSDDNVEVKVTFDQAAYDLNTVIGMTVTVRNIGGSELAFVIGSGSNLIPDALKVELGNLIELFYPEIATLDYQMDTLKPGEERVYECPFVPYTSKDGQTIFGFDKDISFFQTEDFTPAEPGSVPGQARFTYAPISDPTDLSSIGEDDYVAVGGEFSTEILH